MTRPLRISERARRVEPFYVLEMAKAAAEIGRSAAASDRPMVYLNIGEPDFTAPLLVQQAAEKAIRDGRTQYTPALGMAPLRERISDWYRSRHALAVPASRIIVTAGAPHVPDALVEQLSPGGILVIPVGDQYLQDLKRITKKNGQTVTESLGGCRFVKLIGESGWSE